MKPHKHAELIKAWADGAEIECRDCRVWYHAKDPKWQEDMEYRIKPKTKPDIVKTLRSFYNYEIKGNAEAEQQAAVRTNELAKELLEALK